MKVASRLGSASPGFPVFFLVLLMAGASISQDRTEKARILFLGDSLSMEEFGSTLDAGLRGDGLEVYTVVAGGSSPYYWLRAYEELPCTIGFWEKTPTEERKVSYIRSVPKLETMLEKYHPHLVVVQTGINLYASLLSDRKTGEDNVLEVRSLIDQMCHSIAKAGARSYWILPPHSHEQRFSGELQEKLASIMREVIEEYDGAVFESSQVTRYTDPYPANDGVHFRPDAATAWAGKVHEDLSVHLSSALEGVDTEKLHSRWTGDMPSTRLASADVDIQPETSRGKAGPAPEKEDVPPAPEAEIVSLLDLKLRLIRKSVPENLEEFGRSNALGIFEYKVVRDQLGNCPYKKVRVAHAVVLNSRFTGPAKRKEGASISLKLVPLNDYPMFESWHTVDQLEPGPEIPVYTPKLD